MKYTIFEILDNATNSTILPILAIYPVIKHLMGIQWGILGVNLWFYTLIPSLAQPN